MLRVNGLFRLVLGQGKGREVRNVPAAGKSLQCCLSCCRQTVQSAAQEIDNVVGVALGLDAVEIPGEGAGTMVEREQLLFGEFGDELNREERVAAGLVMDELRERARAVVARTERLCEKPADIFKSKRREHDLLRPCAGFEDCIERA